MRVPLTLLFLLVTLGVFQNLAYGPSLPDPVASSFDGAGRPGGYQSRSDFLATHLAVVGIMALALGGSVLLVKVLPLSMVNVPHREYHLAPERAEASLAYISSWMLWFADVTLAFLLFVFQLTIVANLRGTGLPNVPMWGSLAFYFAFVGIAMAAMFARFRRPPAEAVTA